MDTLNERLEGLFAASHNFSRLSEKSGLSERARRNVCALLSDRNYRRGGEQNLADSYSDQHSHHGPSGSGSIPMSNSRAEDRGTAPANLNNPSIPVLQPRYKRYLQEHRANTIAIANAKKDSKEKQGADALTKTNTNTNGTVAAPTITSKYRCSDLILALFCFNRMATSFGVEKANLKPKSDSAMEMRLLESIEVDLTPVVPQLFPYEALSLIHCYALAGRLFPPILEQIDGVIEANLDTLSWKQLGNVLWALAKLNHKPVYTQRLVTLFHKKTKEMARLPMPNGREILSR
jgi:hypothetical protein